MDTYRSTARIVGVLFIIATVASIAAFAFVGLLSDSDYLVYASANENQVLIGMLIEFIWALAVVGIPVFLYPILRKHSHASALGFYSLRFIEAISVVVGSIILLSLLTISQEFVKAGVPDASNYQTVGTLLLAARDWAFMLGSGLAFTLSALLLNYVLYQTKLIPRWLSGWGFIGAILAFATYLVQFFGIDPTDILFLPIAVQEMVFALWLIVKGFNLSAIASLSAQQNQTR